MFFVNNLYKRQTLGSRYRQMTVILRCLLISTVVLLPLVFIFWWDYFVAYGRHFILYFLVVALLSTSLSRLVIVRVFVHPKFGGRRRRLLIVGSDSAALTVVDAIRHDGNSAFQIVGFVDDYKEAGAPIFDDWTILGTLQDLDSIVQKVAPDEILIAIDKAPYSRLVNMVTSCLATGRVVRVFSDRLAVLGERLGAEQYAEGIPVIMLSQVQPSGLSKFVRRVVDILLSLLTLILLSPLLIAVMIGIKMSSRGPVIFRQTRIGYGGKPFDFYKFRSMHIGESAGRHQEYVEKFIKGGSDQNASENEIKVFKIQDDPRIFPFGHFIRRTSLDEFPQLVNVLKGDMGLIGPRPCLPYEWEAYDEWHKDRLKVLPGCTGLWQVLGRSTVTFEDMVIMDLYYISNYSLFQDARILYKTIPTIFFAKGGF
jgi:undecaprenyl-phosphate galactose phosphotransferase